MNYWFRDRYYIWDYGIPIFGFNESIIGRLIEIYLGDRYNGFHTTYSIKFHHRSGLSLLDENVFEQGRKLTYAEARKIKGLP